MRAWLLVVAGCGRVGFDALAAGDAAPDAAPDASCQLGRFSPPTALPGPIQSQVDDWIPTPTVGETQIYFHAYRGTQVAELWFATRASTDVPFDPATNLTATNEPGVQQFSPTLTDDGLVLIYARSSPNAFKLYSTQRTSPTGTFAAPAMLANVNAAQADDSYPFVTGDGLDLVFSSTRNGAVHTLWETVRTDLASAFPVPHELAELVEPGADDWTPTLSHDKLDIFFASTRPGGPGRFDVYTAHRSDPGSGFGAPQLIPELSSPLDDIGLRLTPDGKTIYLNYNAVTAGGGNSDLDVATRACM